MLVCTYKKFIYICMYEKNVCMYVCKKKKSMYVYMYEKMYVCM